MTWNHLFYAPFWADLNAHDPTLQLAGRQFGRNDDADRNHIGTLVGGDLPHVWVHCAFTQSACGAPNNAALRLPFVEYLLPDGHPDEAARLLRRVDPMIRAGLLKRDADARNSLRLFAALADPLTVEQADANRGGLIADFATVYRALLAAARRP